MINSKINYILVGVVGLVIGVMLGLYLAPKAVTVGATPAGGTTSGQTYSSVVIVGSTTATATSSSVTNNTGNDLLITGIRVACEGLGVSKSYVTGSGIANLTMSIATETTSNQVTTNTNTNLAGNVNIGTSTGTFALASSTSVNQLLTNNIWGNGVVLTFFLNATTSGQCTGGVDTVSS